MAASYYCYQCKILDGCLLLNHNKTIESLAEDLKEIWYREHCQQFDANLEQQNAAFHPQNMFNFRGRDFHAIEVASNGQCSNSYGVIQHQSSSQTQVVNATGGAQTAAREPATSPRTDATRNSRLMSSCSPYVKLTPTRLLRSQQFRQEIPVEHYLRFRT